MLEKCVLPRKCLDGAQNELLSLRYVQLWTPTLLVILYWLRGWVCDRMCMCVYLRPSSRLPVNWAKLVSIRKLRGEEGGDVSHLIVALSTSTGDWKSYKSSSAHLWKTQSNRKTVTSSGFADLRPLSVCVSSSHLAAKTEEHWGKRSQALLSKFNVQYTCVSQADQGHDAEMMAGVASEVEKISKEVGINDLQVRECWNCTCLMLVSWKRRTCLLWR